MVWEAEVGFRWDSPNKKGNPAVAGSSRRLWGGGPNREGGGSLPRLADVFFMIAASKRRTCS